jgi:pimeloyl-ACP methyl ester carboxylesterase
MKDGLVTITSNAVQEFTYWTWRGCQIHYVQKGRQGPPILLVHGFGASTDHWRKNIEELSENYRVWAIDMLGFGRSQKPRLTYTGELWRDQLQAFCQEIIQEPVFVAGNSLGGYATLCFAVDCLEWTRGLILINCAGPFSEDAQMANLGWKQELTSLINQFLQFPFVIEIASFLLFNYMRQRSQIRKVLLNVYKDPTAVTDRLVEEIYQPSLDEGALEVFAAVFKSPPGRKLDQLLQSLQRPLLLVWGTADPWMTPEKADKFCAHYPAADLELIDAGHCPHDERPQEVNAAIARWIKQYS